MTNYPLYTDIPRNWTPFNTIRWPEDIDRESRTASWIKTITLWGSFLQVILARCNSALSKDSARITGDDSRPFIALMRTLSLLISMLY